MTFESDAASLALGVPAPVDLSAPRDSRLCVCGTVVDVKPMEPHGPGKIPSAAVTIEGRTKKRVTVDGAGVMLKVWATWAEAIAECQRCNGATAAALPAAPSAPKKASR